MKPRNMLAWSVVTVGLLIALSGCAASMDASKASSRAVIQSGGIVPAQELRVAEYLNYYEQHFPEPANGTLGLDLRLGNTQAPASGGEAWLQIGVQARSTRTEEIAPLNLALVIDCSGSMNTPEKMPYVKQSLRVFLRSLAPEDVIAIVTYSTNSQVILPGQRVGTDLGWIDATIARLAPGGNTNLHGGLMLGFREVDRSFDIRRNNRVVLLTDGNANEGVTDPARIAADALVYNQKGIYLSTIGLGRDFNDKLLSQLATQGKGAYHFIDSAEEMDKVFRQEVSGLVQKAAADVMLTLEPGPGVRVLDITGYQGQPPAGAFQIRLQEMGTGDSQVVLAHLSLDPARLGQREVARVELRYTDLFAQRAESVQGRVSVMLDSASFSDPLRDVAVLRNVTIQRSAEGLKEIDRLYKARRYQEAFDLAYRLEGDLRRVAALTGEAQMTKDADMMRTYQATLSKWIETQTDRESPRPSEATEPSRLYRSATPTPATIDIR